jgi:hypothetical protein
VIEQSPLSLKGDTTIRGQGADQAFNHCVDSGIVAVQSKQWFVLADEVAYDGNELHDGICFLRCIADIAATGAEAARVCDYGNNRNSALSV